MNVIHQMVVVIRMQYVTTLLDQEHVLANLDILEMEPRVPVSKQGFHSTLHSDSSK